MERFVVEYQANWMQVDIKDDEMDIDERLYAEYPWPADAPTTQEEQDSYDWDAFDEKAYPILKESIIRQAEALGIGEDRLKFWWD